MGLLDLFGNKKKRESLAIKRLELESTKRKYSRHQNNKLNQAAMIPMTIEKLLELDVREGDKLKLEFFFYSTSQSKAAALNDHLRTQLGYELNEPHRNGLYWSVSGWTDPQPIVFEHIKQWSDQMCDLGFEFGCEFDGWGTTPHQ